MSELDYDGGTAPPAEQQPIPADGLHDAICYAVVNWGDVLDEYDGEVKGVVHAVRFFFEMDEKMPETWTAPDGRVKRVAPEFVGKPFVLSTFPMAIKYGERAKFVKTMAAWLGGKDTPPSLVGYPLGNMRGKMASLNVEWKSRDDGTFTARIRDIMKARAGAAAMTIVNTKLPAWLAEARAKDNARAARYLAGVSARMGDAAGDGPEPFTGSDPAADDGTAPF